MALVHDSRRAGLRVVSVIAGGAIVWITVLAFARANPVDLAVALLIVLAEVLAVAVFSGPALAVAVALGAVILVNWYLVPPYGTFEIASTENVVALIVFVFVAAVASALVEVGGRARARAEESDRQTELLGDIVASPDGDDAATALDRVRTGLSLDRVELRSEVTGAGERILASAGGRTSSAVVVDVPLPDGYRLIGRGRERFAPDPDFLVSLGSAAVRAFESGLLQEESLRADQLEAIDRSRTALLASVGHDLRTPLASLRISIDALRAPGDYLTEADREALMDTIESSTERLDDLITNLLDMSRLQAGVILAHLESTQLVDVVERSLLAFRADRIRVDIPASLPSVSTDPTLLERVIANLVSNALRYSPIDEPVRLGAHHDATTVVLSVIDRGPGIRPNDRSEVFTPFHRVGAQPDGGTGLGLAIVKGFAEAMAMSVELRTGDEGGLDVRLVIPRSSPDGPTP
jgi:K+-sensing histidine kinase KdpD